MLFGRKWGQRKRANDTFRTSCHCSPRDRLVASLAEGVSKVYMYVAGCTDILSFLFPTGLVFCREIILGMQGRLLPPYSLTFFLLFAYLFLAKALFGFVFHVLCTLILLK